MLFFRRRKSKPVEIESPFHGYVRTGNAFNAQKKWQEAVIQYEKALALQPDDVAIRIQLGHALKEQGFLEEAKAAYRRATLDDPLDADAHLHLGHVLKLLNDRFGAVAAYSRAARLGGDGHVGADADRELRSLGQSVPVKLAVQHPTIASGRTDLTDALRHHRWTSALKIIESSEATHPEFSFTKAQIYQIAGRLDEAIALYVRLAEADRGGKAEEALVAAYFEAGRGKDALVLLKTKLEAAVRAGKAFETQIAIAKEMIAFGGYELVLSACADLFGGRSFNPNGGQRTAVDMKRERAVALLPEHASRRFRQEFIERSKRLAEAGEEPQARLLLDEAEALA